ncbi:hypothetical protein BVY02_02435 [bacterium J17]|nr:hypothetical protein BVY02_02435 [bacterium J17]
MPGSVESFIALRYLRSKRKEVFISIITIISVLGVAVSVLVLDIVLSVMTGFEIELKSKLLDVNSHILVRQYSGPIENWNEIAKEISTVPQVASAEPYTLNQAMLTTDTGAYGVLIRGVSRKGGSIENLSEIVTRETSVDSLFAKKELDVERLDGTIDTVSYPPLIVGKALTYKLGIAPNTLVSVYSPSLSSSPQGLIPRIRRFAVVGDYKSGLMEYESGLAYSNIADSQQFFEMNNGVTGIEVSVTDTDKVREVAEAIREKLKASSFPVRVSDWTELNKDLWEAIELERRVYFIVLSLLILIASFSIVSTLVMVVLEKSRDIAILKSLGATDKQVRNVFLLQSTIIGVSGVIIGTFAGYLGCVGLQKFGFPINPVVFSLEQLPVHIDPINFAIVAGAGVVITSLSGLYPAARAARLKPADALRFE